MSRPTLPDPEKVRDLDGSFTFGWIDHRIKHFWEDFSPEEFRLYFFLIAVGDRYGCSWYASRSIQKTLKMSPSSLQKARGRLEKRRLIACRKEELSGRYVYQVLPLPMVKTEEPIEIPLVVNIDKNDDGKKSAASVSDEQAKTNLQNMLRLRNLLGD